MRYIKLLCHFNCFRRQHFAWFYICALQNSILSHPFLGSLNYVIWGFELLLDFLIGPANDFKNVNVWKFHILPPKLCELFSSTMLSFHFHLNCQCYWSLLNWIFFFL
jgi:hypothetical protein